MGELLTFFPGELISPLRRVKAPNPKGIVRGEGGIVYESTPNGSAREWANGKLSYLAMAMAMSK